MLLLPLTNVAAATATVHEHSQQTQNRNNYTNRIEQVVMTICRNHTALNIKFQIPTATTYKITP